MVFNRQLTYSAARALGKPRSLVRAIFWVAVFLPTALSAARCEAISLGVMGDSLSDEYQYTCATYARNWVEQLATYGGVNLGPVGTYPAPRNTGYAYNWARSGATSVTLLSGGQASGLAAQIPGTEIQYVVLAIGANDFAPWTSAYNGIYNNTWSSSQIDTYVSTVVANVETALDTVLPTGVKVAVATAPDYGITPYARADYSDPTKRQRVADVISMVNTGIKGLAQSDHLVVADLSGLSVAIFGTHASPNTTISIGNVPIYLDQISGSNPSQAGFVADGIHPNTALQGAMANLFVQALDTGYAAGVPLFTESEILAHNGLSYGGSDTLVLEMGPYSDFVINYVPEPSVWLMLGTVAAAVGLWRWRRY